MKQIETDFEKESFQSFPSEATTEKQGSEYNEDKDIVDINHQFY